MKSLKSMLCVVSIFVCTLSFADKKEIKKAMEQKAMDKVSECLSNPDAPGCQRKSDSGKDLKEMSALSDEMKAKENEANAQGEAACRENTESEKCKAHMSFKKQKDKAQVDQLTGLVGGLSDMKSKKEKDKLQTLREEVAINCNKKAETFSEDLCKDAKEAYKAALK